MSGAASAASYAAVTSVQAPLAALNTASWFDHSHADSQLSPIDQLIENTNGLNVLVARATPQELGQLGPLILLGHVSAVESFFRALIRRLINLDDASRAAAAEGTVSFGAVLHHAGDMLPEALLESVSLASPINVTKTFQNFVGIDLLQGEATNSPRLRPHMREFQKICELRHCCVHRFGRLGYKNAAELGLAAHRRALEKPLRLDAAALEAVSGALRSYAKAVNNKVCEQVLDRTCKTPPYNAVWTWHWGRDRRRFLPYHALFASTLDGVPSPDARSVYDSLRVRRAAAQSRR